MFNSYMQDCIHLKACRRLQKIGRGKGHSFSRDCDENCSAYISGDSEPFCTVDAACHVAWSQYDGSHDCRDVYAHCDFPTETLGEIIERLYEEDD